MVTKFFKIICKIELFFPPWKIVEVSMCFSNTGRAQAFEAFVLAFIINLYRRITISIFEGYLSLCFSVFIL